MQNRSRMKTAFDVIALNLAFHRFENKPKSLDEIYRVLKVGGMLLMHDIRPSAAGLVDLSLVPVNQGYQQ